MDTTTLKLETKSFGELADIVKQHINAPELELNRLYDIRKFGWTVQDHNDEPIPVIGLIRKHSAALAFEFSDGSEIIVSTHHLFATDDRRDVTFAAELRVGDSITKIDGTKASVVSVTSLPPQDVYDIQVKSQKMLYRDAAGFVHHNTHTVEETLGELGLEDGNGYFKNTSSGSAAGLYKTLFMNRTGIVVLDDCDTIVATQEGRNLLKAALDTKKKRKLVWAKMGSWLFDPADEEEMAKAQDSIAVGEEPEMFPRYFDFEGRVIMISNLPAETLDPDGALATRGFIITLNPTKDEVFAFMRKIAPKIPVEGRQLTDAERNEVVDMIEKQPGSANIRKLVRGLNMMASGVPNYQRIIERYC